MSTAPKAERLLRASAALWYAVAVAGLWAFGAYIAALYGAGLAGGDLSRWNRVLPDGHGYVAGDMRGNLALGAHLATAFIVTLSGGLQLVPQIRARAPWLHRWNGRLFVAVAVVAATSGLFIALTRGAVAGTYMTVGNALNAALVLTFAAQ
ncbi:MAG: DUF2306 domain-containing protein, partial [Phenylobacterium sp.]